MPDKHQERLKRDDSPAQAKRTGRDGAQSGDQPGEFVDDMRVNRDRPPEPPRPDEEPTD